MPSIETPSTIHPVARQKLSIDAGELAQDHRDRLAKQGGPERFADYIEAAWGKVRDSMSHPRYEVLKRAAAAASRVQLRCFRLRQVDQAQARIEADHAAAVRLLEVAQANEQEAAAVSAEINTRHAGVNATWRAKHAEREQLRKAAEADVGRATQALRDAAEGPAADIEKASTGLAKARAALSALHAGDKPEDQAIAVLEDRAGELSEQLRQAEENHHQAKIRLQTASHMLAGLKQDMTACAFIEKQFIGALDGSIPAMAAMAAVEALKPVEVDRVPLRAPYFSDVLMHAQTPIDFAALCAPFEHLPLSPEPDAQAAAAAAAEAKRGPPGQSFLPDPVEGTFRVGGAGARITIAGVEQRVRKL